MFDIGWSELLVIAVVAIIVVGPRDLPRMLRTFGQYVGKMKRMAGEFQSQFNEALREAELDTLKKDVEALAEVNPIADVQREVEDELSAMTSIGDDIKTAVEAPAPAKSEAAAPATQPAETPPAPAELDQPARAAEPAPRPAAKAGGGAG